MKKLLLTAAMLAALIGSANAGDNSCNGTVTAGKIDDCTFAVASPVGRKILKICPIGSECSISLELGASRKSIKMRSIEWIEGPEGLVRF
jgi:hypothetical protein